MRIAIIVLITVVVIEQLSFEVIGCGCGNRKGNSTAEEQLKPKIKPRKLKNKQILANGTITFKMKKKLGEGLTASVYAGKTKDGTRVAVKLFSNSNRSLDAYHEELECYKKLGATTGDECKKYGIPPILYYGPGADSVVLVMPMYNTSISRLSLNNIIVSDESWLSIMQQLVITLKYMHSKGVIHGDLHQGNMMVDLNQVLLLDLGGKHKKVSESSDMLELFLEICDAFKLKKFMEDKIKAVGLGMATRKNQIIKEATANKTINSNYVKPLLDCCIEVIKAYASKGLPNYDELYKILETALNPKGNHNQRFVFNWLSDEEKAIARKISIGTIDSIQFNNV